MTRPVIDRRSNQYTNYNQYNQNPITNPIIDGYFPTHKTYKEMAITRVNRTLCAILILFILTSAVSYYFVTANEITLNKYRKQTLALNDENVELQNKLDYLKSYYNVDKAMQKQHLLQKAKTVIEVKDTPATAPVNNNVIAKAAEASQKPFQWSIGF
ncbi:MAG: hypothetical protein KHX03_00970 [Clostridium sp.]|nr:hypothetical protein [Clostridium sp.]